MAADDKINQHLPTWYEQDFFPDVQGFNNKTVSTLSDWMLSECHVTRDILTERSGGKRREIEIDTHNDRMHQSPMIGMVLDGYWTTQYLPTCVMTVLSVTSKLLSCTVIYLLTFSLPLYLPISLLYYIVGIARNYR